ncbi:hypothetical protein DF186_21495, partial [Enterococcus hirae]
MGEHHVARRRAGEAIVFAGGLGRKRRDEKGCGKDKGDSGGGRARGARPDPPEPPAKPESGQNIGHQGQKRRRQDEALERCLA